MEEDKINIRDQISCLSSKREDFCCDLLKVHLRCHELRVHRPNFFRLPKYFTFFIVVCYSMSKRSRSLWEEDWSVLFNRSFAFVNIWKSVL